MTPLIQAPSIILQLILSLCTISIARFKHYIKLQTSLMFDFNIWAYPWNIVPIENSLKRTRLGALYIANSHSIQNNCLFKITEAREKIFELSENTWAVYSVGTISTNEVCPASNEVT